MLSPSQRSGRAGEPPMPGSRVPAGAAPAGVPGGAPIRDTAAARAGAMLVRCDAGGGSYCLDAGRVAAIERAERFTVDPAQGGRLGWLDGPREPLPVYALAALLGLEAPPIPSGPIVVVAGADGVRRGLAVDRVARVTAGTGSLALPEPVRAAAGGRFAGAVQLGDGLALLLAPDRLVASGGAGADPREAEAGQPSPPTVEAGGAGVLPPERRSVPARSAAARTSHSTGLGRPAESPVLGAASGLEPAPRALMLFSAPRNGRHGATLFGLSLAQVEEVLRPVPVTPVPGARDGVLGVLLWRDRVVAVIDLSGDPASDPAAGPPGRLLVVRGVRRPGRVAFPVRADLRVEPLPLPSRAWADAPRISPLAALGVFEVAAGTVVVPDVDRILTPDRAGPQFGHAARSAPDERGECDENS